MNYKTSWYQYGDSAVGKKKKKIVDLEAILIKNIIKSAYKRWYFYDNDDIQILFQTKNPWGYG